MSEISKELLSNARSWPYEEARKIIKRVDNSNQPIKEIVLETGYGPSGLPHIGTFGEVFRTTMVRNALKSLTNLPTKLIAFSDDMDGLRKVPDNVPNQDLLRQFINQPLTSVPDPFEKFNRRAHNFNSSVDNVFFKPVAEIYDSGTPEFFQAGISNVFGNLGDASSAANNILQLKPFAFAKDLSRFIINSTMGLFGIFDIASEMGIEGTNEDFGQTLGHWGISSGPYIVIPFYGPSNLRDSFSIIPDLYLYPNVPRDDSARIASGALNLLDLRSDLLGVTEISGSDQYTFYRDAYIQRRDYQINDGELEEDLIFDEFD